MVTALHLLALALYLTAAGVLGGSLAGGRRGAPPAGGVAVGGAVLAHAVALAGYVFAFGELPLVGLAPSLSALGFMIGALLLVAAVLGEGRTLGVILSPIVAILIAAALWLGIRPTGELTAFRGLWLYFHTTLAFIGFAGLALAFAAGLVYLLQHRELKGKRLGRVFRFFPSLEALDEVERWALAIGFPAYTLGLLVGWAWLARFEQPSLLREPKLIWGALIWLAFVAALSARAGSGGRQRRRGALVSVVGFLAVVLAYLVLRLAERPGGVFL
jgi:ABC-type uncharacterized transport system permease subunit